MAVAQQQLPLVLLRLQLHLQTTSSFSKSHVYHPSATSISSSSLNYYRRRRHPHHHHPHLLMLHRHRHKHNSFPAFSFTHPQDQGEGKGNTNSNGEGKSLSFEEWDSLTAKFSGAANIPFLLLQLPQIILNARNLLAGDKSALFAVPWLGMLTGLLGNLSLLSYFAKKKEKEAVVVQTLGVISTYVVIAQLAIAGAMPLFHFFTTSFVVAAGLILNFLNYFSLLNTNIWRFWEDFTTVGGLTVLPQVMWSTFVPYIPNSILPGTISFIIAVGAVALARMGKLSEEGTKLVGAMSGWTATLLFMWMPVSQMWTNFLNPDNIKGLSASSMLLAMIGNGLMIPRALFIRDFMWFTGSTWGSLSYGYANIVCMYCFHSISKELFLTATAGLVSWIGMALWRDTAAYGYTSPLTSIKELISAS